MKFLSYICTAKPNEVMKLVILSCVLVFLATILLGVKVLFVKGGKFPSGHVGSNPELRRRNIRCSHSEESER